MADFVFPITNTHVNAGTTRTPFVNVTSRVAGHTEYSVAIDVSGWLPAEAIAIGIEFRIDNATIVAGCQLTTNGGVHHGMDGSTVILPSCGQILPAFGASLEARAVVTVPSAGFLSGQIVLV